MRSIRLRIALTLLLLAALLTPALADGPDWFPFVIPWDDAGPGATNVSALNPTPAGAGGFLTTRDGHFYDAKGQRVRFLGVNFCYRSNFPDKADAAKIAARLHKYGVNIVRFHAADTDTAPRGIWDARYKDRQHLDPDQLDRLDYLIAQLKAKGIYVNLNLFVGRRFTAADGLPDTDRLGAARTAVAYFDPRWIKLQKNYVRDLLTHTNPYTKTRYADDPAIAVVELTNESTLLGAAWYKTLEELPPSYRDELARQWNAWLKARYTDNAGLQRAWRGGAVPLSPELLRSGADHWRVEQHAGASAALQAPADARPPAGAEGRVLRLAVAKAGKEGWHVQMHQAGVDVQDATAYTVSFWARADRKRPLNVGACLDQGNYRNIGLNDRVMLDTQWKQYDLPFKATQPVKGHTRVVFAAGTDAGTVELAGISLRAGLREALPPGASLDAGTIPPGRVTKGPSGQDWVAFLIDTERRFVKTMRDYLRKDLGARVLVTGSQTHWGGLGGLARERASDFTDMHVYWQHPRFPRRPWDPEDWTIEQKAMTRDKEGGTLPHLARYRLAGLPYTISEYNHAAPLDYQAECLPMLAAFAAAQDWDGIYLFDYNSDGNWNSGRIRGAFSIDANPAHMALLPAAALIFLRGDVPPAAGSATLLVPADSVAEQLARNGKDEGILWGAVRKAWDGVGVRPLDAVDRRLAVEFLPGEKGQPRLRRGGAPGGKSPLAWQGTGTEQALFTADSPRSKVMVGTVGGRTVALSGWQVTAPKKGDGFAALTLSALDGKPMAQARSLLLTAVGRVGNTNMGWNAEHTSVGKNWGTAPTRAQGIAATVRIETQARAAKVYALDGSGKRRAQVDATLADGRLTFAIGPAHRTLWYEIVISQ